MISKKKLINLFIYIYGFLLIFNPNNFFSFNLLFIITIFSFFIIFLTKNSMVNFYSNKRFLIFTLFNICYFLYYFILNVNVDSNRGYTIFITYLGILNAYAFILIYIKSNDLNFDKFLRFITNIMLIQMFFVLLSVFIPEFRNWALSTARSDSLVSVSNDHGFMRSFGLSLNYTSGLPMAIGVCSLFVAYFLIEEKNIILKIRYLITLLLFLFAISVNARIGLMPVIFLVMFLPLIVFSHIKHIFSYLAVMLGVMILYFVFSDDIDQSGYLERVQEGVEEVKSLFSGRKEGNIEALYEMFILPDNNYDLFFGQGFETLTSLSITSDLGFIRDIYMFGLLYVILFFSVFYYLMKPLLGFFKERFGYLFVIIFILSLLAYYGKGMIYSSTEIYNLLFVLSVFCCLKISLDRKNEGVIT